MKNTREKGFMMIGGVIALASFAGALFVFLPSFDIARGQESVPHEEHVATVVQEDRVVVDLDAMTITLAYATGTPVVMPIVSKGKPGSYYETPAGAYTTDYKIPLHFSSIGHVYMPYSVHVFGNFFIHGIPYYPDGEKVSSTYSGGCIRLEDAHARAVYDFVTRGTPVIITGKQSSQEPLTLTPREMTTLMVATVSLEFLQQDNEVIFEGTTTTRRSLIPRLLQTSDDSIAEFLSWGLGQALFVERMNEKARAIGLSDTTFSSVTGEPSTTVNDLRTFGTYLTSHKSYLVELTQAK